MAKIALVVDDSMVIRKMVSMTLSAAGFEILQAANGKEAMDKAKDVVLALVITDLNMPVMNGLELIKALRAETGHKFTPIVLLTTDVDERLRKEAGEAGATAWIQKPFHPDKVMSVVNRVAA